MGGGDDDCSRLDNKLATDCDSLKKLFICIEIDIVKYTNTL